MRKPFLRGDKRFWSPIAISIGLAVVFFGILRTDVSLTIKWINIGIGIALIIIGFSISPLRAVKENKPQSPEPNAPPTRQVNQSEYRAYMDERRSLVNSLRDQARSFDRYILTLAGGTFGLSLVIIKTLAPQPLPQTMPFLLGAWVAFGTSILFTLISFLLSQKACLRNIELIDARLSEASSSQKCESTNIFAKLTMTFNKLSISSFIIGVILLINFGYQNLPVAQGA